MYPSLCGRRKRAHIRLDVVSRESQGQSTPHDSISELWGVRTIGIARVEGTTISPPNRGSNISLEAEYDASLYAKVALIVIAGRERISEAC
jgi:hypothetical protein